MKRILPFIFLWISGTFLMAQKKEFDRAMELGPNIRGYIVIKFKHPQEPDDVKKLCSEKGYELLSWNSGKTVKFGDHVEGPLEFFLMEKKAFHQLVNDCREFNVNFSMKNLDNCIDQVARAKKEKKGREERELAEQKRIDALAAAHVPSFKVDPSWNNFDVTDKHNDIAFVRWNGKRGVVFNGTKTWIMPPLYKNIGNFQDRIFVVSNSFKEEPQIFDRQYREIKYTEYKDHNRKSGALLQVIKGSNGLYGMKRIDKDGSIQIMYPPIANAISDLIYFRKDNLVFSGYEDNEIIAFATEGKLGFMRKDGAVLLDSIEEVQDKMFKLPVLPFTEFLVVTRCGSRYYFDPIKLEGYTERAVRDACNNTNERQLAEHFLLFKAVGAGMRVGLEYLIDYSNKWARSSTQSTTTVTEGNRKSQIVYQSKSAEVEIELFEPHSHSTTFVEIYSKGNNDHSDKDYISILRVLDKYGDEVRKKEYRDAYKDNKAEIYFDSKYSDHIEVTVHYGSTDYPLFGKPQYNGVGTKIKLYEQGTYRINVTRK